MADNLHSDLGFTPSAPATNAHADLGFTPAADAALDNPQNKLLYKTPEGIPVYGAGDAWKQPEGSAIGRGASGLWDNTVGGFLGLLKSAAAIAAAGSTGNPPDLNSPGMQAVLGLVQSHIDQAEKAKQAIAEGRTSEAIGHTLATILPMIGPAAAHAGESFGTDQLPQFDRYGNVVKQGQAPDIARGVGETVGLVGTSALPLVKGRIPTPALPDVPPFFKNTLNPVEQGAIDLLKSEGVPLRAGVQTGNRYLKAAEGVVEATPLGSVRAAEFNRGTEAGLTNLGQRLMDEAHPRAETPESAGAAIRGGLDSRIEQYGNEADAAYNKAWQGRDNPDYTYDMPVRREPEIGADGKPTGQMKEVRKPVNMPVDVTDIKDMAEPVREELQWALSRTEQSQSKAFGAVEKLLAGDDYIPAWQAERALSALKSLARTTNKTGVRDYGQGVAAGLVPKLQEAIDAAVANTGQDAIRGLQEGRAAHANMMDVVSTAEKLHAEPVQAFGQAVWAHDSGIAFLRRIAHDAPDALPKVGRALIQDLFDRVTREGGIGKTTKTLNTWRDLGDETKALLFPDAKLRTKLDGFFKGLDMVVQRTNPSGTEITRQATSLNPARWIAGFLGGHVLFTERGIQLLTDGLRAPAGSAKARMIQKELRDMGGQEPPEQGPPAGDGQPGGQPAAGGGFVNKAKQAFERLKNEEEGSVELPGGDQPVSTRRLPLHNEIARYFWNTTDDFKGKPAEALSWVRKTPGGFAAGAIPHPEIPGGIGLLHGEPGGGAPEWRGGFGVTHADAKRTGYLDEAVKIIPSLPVIETIKDPKSGRVLGKVLFDGKHRAVISHDLRGHETPAWLLTSYERSAPATSSSVSGARKGAGPTPPATDR